MMEDINDFIFSSTMPFEEKAIQVFHFQYKSNQVYKRFVDGINCRPSSVKHIEQIPFLPISFFKSHKVTSGEFSPKVIFTSSGTTGAATSKHFVKDIDIYEKSFVKGFESFYGNIKNYCVLGLLPSYLEREGSSLVYMIEKMMSISQHPLNGFHLYDHEVLSGKLLQLQEEQQQTLLIGTTFGLLDFAAKFPMQLRNIIVMETGGMKGRGKELVRQEVHSLLQKAHGVETIHSEYGMTELLSQAYALQHGKFHTPSWMKILIREEDDPLTVSSSTIGKELTGAINIIDLANIYSCSFIATDDVGRLYPNRTFEVLGRLDGSDIRGCSLLTL